MLATSLVAATISTSRSWLVQRLKARRVANSWVEFVWTVHSVWPDPLAAQYSKSSWAARRSGTAQLLSNWALWDGVTCRSWATLHDNLTVFSTSRLERDMLWG